MLLPVCLLVQKKEFRPGEDKYKKTQMCHIPNKKGTKLTVHWVVDLITDNLSYRLASLQLVKTAGY